jgi:hypothetical protein
MAKATERLTKVIKTVEVKDGVVLELTQREADVLFAILGRVCGPTNGPRDETSNIWATLHTLCKSDGVLNIDKMKTANSGSASFWVE